MCDCRSDLEARLLERFKEQHPEASCHEVAIQGYAYFFRSNSGVKATMLVEQRAVFPLKNGGSKSKVVKTNMIATFCPFCGVKYDKEEASHG